MSKFDMANLIYKTLENEKGVITKLIDPLENLSKIRQALIFIYPAIITDTIGGTKEEELFRRFFAIQMLKELSISNMIIDIVDILNSPYDEIKTKKDIEKFDIPYAKTMAAKTAAEIFEKHKQSAIERSKEIYDKLKKIIENDPYYKQYQACISFDKVNDIVVPIIVGTKNFQVNDWALGFFLLTAIIFDLPPISYANVVRLEKILKSKLVNVVFQIFQNKGKLTSSDIKVLKEKVSNHIKSNKVKRFFVSMINYLQNISDKINSFFSNPAPLFSRHKLAFSQDDLDAVITVFKLCTNIHYYSSQMNDNFSQIAVKTYLEFSKKDLEKDIAILYKKIIDALSLALETIEDLKIITDFSLPENLYLFDKDKLKSFLSIKDEENELIDILIDIADELSEKNCAFDEKIIYNIITNFKNFVSELKVELENIFSKILKDKRLKDDADEISLSTDSEFSFISKLIYKFFSFFKRYDSSFEKLSSFKELSKYVKEIKGNKKALDKIILSIIKDKYGPILNFSRRKNSKILEFLINDIKLIYEKYFKYIIDYIEKQFDLEIKFLKDFSLSVKEKAIALDIKEDIDKIFENVLNNVKNFSEKLIAFLIYIILDYIICAYLKNLINAIDISKIKMDISDVRKNVTKVFPNYVLIATEELLNFLATNLSILMPEKYEKAFDLSLPPEKYPNPLDTNPKYKAHYIFTNLLKIPSYIIWDKKNRVTYKTLFMRKPEKTTIDKIKRFVKTFSIIFKS